MNQWTPARPTQWSRALLEYGCQAGLVIGLLALAVANPIQYRSFGQNGGGDYWLNHRQSERAAAARSYDPALGGPESFVYPPAGVLLRLAWGAMGYNLSAVVWMLLLAGSGWALAHWSFELLGLSGAARRWAVACGAFFTLKYFLEWDLRALNCNLMIAALAVGALAYSWKPTAARSAAAGVMLALAVTLKLYAVLLAGYWVVRGRWAAVTWFLAGMVVAFVVWPSAAFGPRDAWRMTMSWREAVTQASQPAAATEYRAYITSLHRGVLGLNARLAETGMTTRRDDEVVWRITRWLHAAWLIALLGYALIAWRRGWPADLPATWALDGAAMLLAPLPFSPLLQPHHGAAALLAALVLVDRLADPTERAFVRNGALAALAACFAILECGPAGELRGLGLHMVFCILLAAMASLRAGGGRKRAAAREPADLG